MFEKLSDNISISLSFSFLLYVFTPTSPISLLPFETSVEGRKKNVINSEAFFWKRRKIERKKEKKCRRSKIKLKHIQDALAKVPNSHSTSSWWEDATILKWLISGKRALTSSSVRALCSLPIRVSLWISSSPLCQSFMAPVCKSHRSCFFFQVHNAVLNPAAWVYTVRSHCSSKLVNNRLVLITISCWCKNSMKSLWTPKEKLPPDPESQSSVICKAS